MKRLLTIIMISVISFSLTACALALPAASTDDPSSTASVKEPGTPASATTEPDPGPDIELGELRYLDESEREFFTDFVNSQPVNGFIASSYTDVRDADLDVPFYNEGKSVTDEQRKRALELAGEEEVYMGVFRITTEEINELLNKYTGYSLDSFRSGLDTWYYDYEDHSYYHFCGDVNLTPYYVDEGYVYQSEYVLHLLRDETFWGNEPTDDGYHENRMELVLKEISYGEYHIVSCREMVEESALTDWCYEVTFPNYGECQFYAYGPDKDGDDATFKLVKDGRTVFNFGEFPYDNKISGTFDSIADIGFKDFNNDGFPDFVAVINYKTEDGDPVYDYKVFASTEWKYSQRDLELEAALRDASLNPTYSAAYEMLSGLYSKDSRDWKKYYADRIKDFRSEDTIRTYDLIRIDDDDIPELVCVGDCEAAGNVLYTWNNGVTDELWMARLHFEYLRTKGKVLSSDGNMGYYWDVVYELENGHFTEIASGEYGDDMSQEPDPETGYPYYYKFNGNDVSKDDYYKKLEMFYSDGYSYEGYYLDGLLTTDEMTNMLTDNYSKLY